MPVSANFSILTLCKCTVSDFSRMDEKAPIVKKGHLHPVSLGHKKSPYPAGGRGSMVWEWKELLFANIIMRQAAWCIKHF